MTRFSSECALSFCSPPHSPPSLRTRPPFASRFTWSPSRRWFSPPGPHIVGLNASDFQLFDNGLPENITLDSVSTPISVAVVVQASRDVREYTTFISNFGSVIDALLVGEHGHAAVIAYNDDIAILKSLVAEVFRPVCAPLRRKGAMRAARRSDARRCFVEGSSPLARPRPRLLDRQPLDRGSDSALSAIEEQLWDENISVYALALPEAGKSFASDTFMVQGISGADGKASRA